MHGFDVLAQQMPEKLPQVEAAYRTVARCQGRVVCFHPTLPELPALFGMPNQGFNTSAAIFQAGAHLRLPPRQTRNIQTGLLWFWRHEQFVIYHLRGPQYESVPNSVLLPNLNVALLAEYVLTPEPLDALVHYRHRLRQEL